MVVLCVSENRIKCTRTIRHPLLVGRQGTHKSTFCREMIPPALRAYYTDSIDFSQKRDAELYLNRFALINIDEFDQITLPQQGFLETYSSKACGQSTETSRSLGT